MRCAWVVMLAGCGRLEFSAIPDGALDPDAPPCTSPVGHDEDADGVDDACDVCPHLPDAAQADRDGDRVGDACDPRPDTPTERIALFDPFTVQRPEWTFNGANAPVFTGESITIDSLNGNAVAVRSVTPTTEVFAIGGRLGAGNPTQRHQQILSLYPASPQSFYCELYFDVGVPKFSLTYTIDGNSFGFVDDSEAQAPLENANFTLTFAYSPATSQCDTTYPTTDSRIAGATPAGLGMPLRVGFAVGGLVVRYDWFIQIHSD